MHAELDTQDMRQTARAGTAQALRNVIIVSPYFPPSTLAGVHRARLLAKHLPAAGWYPIIVCVDEAFHEQTLDPDLAALVPPYTEIMKVGALPVSVTRKFGFGDIAIRAWRGLRMTVMGLLEHRSIDAVLITGSPFLPMLMAPEIRRRFGIPVVLDLQDPWVSRWGANQPLLGKAGLSHRLAVKLEPRALRGASYITSVSKVQNAELAERYPWLDASRMAAIPIGGDPEDFNALRARPPSNPQVALDPGRINLSYVGTFLPRAGPLVRQVFRAVKSLKETQPQLAERLRLNFVGTSNQPDPSAAGLVTPIAVEEGVGDLVAETPRRVPFLEALNILANSNGLLLIGSDEPHYTASKIYPALMSGRPYVSVFHAASSAHAILSKAGGGRALSFADADGLGRLTPLLADALLTMATAPELFGKSDPAAYEDYTARSVARSFAEVFDAAAAAGPGTAS